MTIFRTYVNIVKWNPKQCFCAHYYPCVVQTQTLQIGFVKVTGCRVHPLYVMTTLFPKLNISVTADLLSFAGNLLVEKATVMTEALCRKVQGSSGCSALNTLNKGTKRSEERLQALCFLSWYAHAASFTLSSFHPSWRHLKKVTDHRIETGKITTFTD